MSLLVFCSLTIIWTALVYAFFGTSNALAFLGGVVVAVLMLALWPTSKNGLHPGS